MGEQSCAMLISLALQNRVKLRGSRPVYCVVHLLWTPDNQFSQNLSIKERNVNITTMIFGALEEWLVWVAERVGYPS
jgi:hypothetical protein